MALAGGDPPPVLQAITSKAEKSHVLGIYRLPVT
jgi:hypothetical protein